MKKNNWFVLNMLLIQRSECSSLSALRRDSERHHWRAEVDLAFLPRRLPRVHFLPLDPGRPPPGDDPGVRSHLCPEPQPELHHKLPGDKRLACGGCLKRTWSCYVKRARKNFAGAIIFSVCRETLASLINTAHPMTVRLTSTATAGRSWWPSNQKPSWQEMVWTSLSKLPVSFPFWSNFVLCKLVNEPLYGENRHYNVFIQFKPRGTRIENDNLQIGDSLDHKPEVFFSSQVVTEYMNKNLVTSRVQAGLTSTHIASTAQPSWRHRRITQSPCSLMPLTWRATPVVSMTTWR